MKGFTLIEILVVLAITVLMTGLLIANFSRMRVDLNQSALMAQDAIREAQADALSGALIQGTYRCGYGIHFDATSYFIYAGPDSSTTACAGQNRNYEPGVDQIVRQALLGNNVLEFVQPIPDIFFVPPNPTTYIDGGGTSVTIRLHRIGAACPSSDCREIYVTTSGLIQSK